MNCDFHDGSDPSQTPSRAPFKKPYDFFHKAITNLSLFGQIRLGSVLALHGQFPDSQPVSQLASQEGPQGLSAAARPTRGPEGLASSVPFATTVPSQRGSTKNGLRPQIALPVPLPDRLYSSARHTSTQPSSLLSDSHTSWYNEQLS